MAVVDESQLSLMSLEDELTCSICLSPFEYPVTIPCGHNFCQSCLLITWTDSYSCPQCRTLFATKPELKKNTVLSSVVEAFKVRSSGTPEGPSVQGENRANSASTAVDTVAEDKRVIRCDACMEAEASQTCLTCMASFCEEHLRPHRENPVFRLHQLSEPIEDLTERICLDHNKLMDFFCRQHSHPICSLCLQQTHQGCCFVSPEEQRNQKEADLRAMCKLLDEKLAKNTSVIAKMEAIQHHLKVSANDRKRALAENYQQIRDMLAWGEKEAMDTVDREVETGQDKLKGLMKKFTENVGNMSKAKQEIYDLLSQSHTMAFLKGSYALPPAVKFDPYTPRINLDSKKVLASEGFAAALKDYLTEILKQPIEARMPLLKPDVMAGKAEDDERPASASGFKPVSRGSEQEYGPQWPGYKKLPTRSHSPGPNFQGKGPLKKKPQKPNKKPSEDNKKDEDGRRKNLTHSMENLLESLVKDKPRGPHGPAESKKTLETVDIPLNIASAVKRSELLKYGTVLTLDPKTAHRRILLSDGFTNASVSDEHMNYPECPQRFAVCSQVLASKGFSRGRHYWEVKMSSNNFIGIGLAYGTIDRKGPTSRLGRNSQSWCVEWFNVKLSAWHNSSETVLLNPNPKRVGVLLDCEGGTATFYSIGDFANPFHSFVFPFAKAVYPAFWIFSSGSSITLCKLQA